MLEAELEKKCLEIALKYPTISTWKVKAGGQRHSIGAKVFFKKSSIPGFPDLLLCANGLFVGVELKTSTGRQSPVQKICQKKIEDSRGKYYIIRNEKDFINLLEEYK